MKRTCVAEEPIHRPPETLQDDGLLAQRRVEELLEQTTPVHRLFLAALGRGVNAIEAARRSGWAESEAERAAALYLSTHPVVAPLAAHLLRLRELALMEERGLFFATLPGIQ